MAGGDYRLVAERLAPAHEELVARLEPRAGARWLDEPAVWRADFDAPERVWEWWSTAMPPFVGMLRGLDPERRAAVRDEMLALAERRHANGRVEFTREYVLVLGRRR